MATRFQVTVSSGSQYLAAEDGSADDTIATSRLDVVADYPIGEAARVSLVQALRINGEPEQRIEVRLGGTAKAEGLASALRVMVSALDFEEESRREHPDHPQPEDPARLCEGLLEFLEPLAGTSPEIDGWVARLRNTVGS